MDYAAVYGKMHENPKIFPGNTLLHHVYDIAGLVEQYRPARLLDYGSGKGYQYLAYRAHEHWPGKVLPHCYDVGVRQLAKRPEGKFAGIICTGVLEHIDEPDVDAIVADIFSFAEGPGFAFFVIGTAPAKKHLPDGRNAHLTIWPEGRWHEKLREHAPPDVRIETRFDWGQNTNQIER